MLYTRTVHRSSMNWCAPLHSLQRMAADGGSDRFDEVLGAVAQQHRSIVGLLSTLFSFLHRRTDFYVSDPDPKRRMGFAPGQAEQLLLTTFRRFPLRDPTGRPMKHVEPSPTPSALSASATVAKGASATAASAAPTTAVPRTTLTAAAVSSSESDETVKTATHRTAAHSTDDKKRVGGAQLPQPANDACRGGANVSDVASKSAVAAPSKSAVSASTSVAAPAIAAGSSEAAAGGPEQRRGAAAGSAAAAGLGGFATPPKAARPTDSSTAGASVREASIRGDVTSYSGGAAASTPRAAPAAAAAAAGETDGTTSPAAATAPAHAPPSAVTPVPHAVASKRQPRSQALAAAAAAPRVRFTPDGKQVPIGNGGVGPADAYWWTQSLHDLSLHVVLPPGVRSKRQLGVRVGRDSVEVLVTGVAAPAAAPAACIRASADADAGPTSSVAATDAGSADSDAAATRSGSGAPASAAGGATVVMLAGQLYGPVRVDTESCGPAGVFWTWDSDARSAQGRPRLPREAGVGTGAGGDNGGAEWAAGEEDDDAGREAEAEGEGQDDGEACGGVLTIPLEKAEDVWWRRILADPQAAAMPPHVVGLSGAGASDAAGAKATSAAAARGVGTPARAAAAVTPARPTPGTRRAPGTVAGVPSPAIPGLGAAPSPYDIDASLVDSTRPVADYDADTQSAIRRIMYEQVSE